jgi:low affinity Fe/Cu permease
MSDKEDYVERTTEGPTTVRREEVRVVRGSSSTGWIIAAIVAVAAIVGAFFYLNQNSQADLQAARDQGAVQAQVDNAASSAQQAASDASQAAQSSMSSAARSTQNAANAAADRSATAADQAARDASATAPSRSPPQ